jgi:2-phosphosulfolactate phosphatase
VGDGHAIAFGYGLAMPTVVIDCFPSSAHAYRDGHAIVAVDVLRATTTAQTAVALGRRCYPVPSIEEALPLAARLEQPLLVGELGGNMPYGFDLQNSPAQVAALEDASRPMILLSTSGTPMLWESRGAPAVYVGSLRNLSAQAAQLAQAHEHVALLAAGTRGEFREEDQLCCAWLASKLLADGYDAADEKTAEIARRWDGEPVEALLVSNSVEYLKRTGQLVDVDFVLNHVDDLQEVFEFVEDEIVLQRG